jgi:hypothetical protein
MGRPGEGVKISFVGKNLPSLKQKARSTLMIVVWIIREVRPCARMGHSFAALTLGLVVQL